MVISKKILYMAFGGILTLSLVFGAFATFAQTDEGSDDAVPAESDESTDTTPTAPLFEGRDGHRGFAHPVDGRSDNDELLAEALGVTVEELQAANEAVRAALIEQAVVDGLLTQEQADQLLSGTYSARGGRGFMPRGFDNSDVDVEAMLADALGVSVDELQAAREAVNAAKLDLLVADGVITQEQADLMQARRALQDYVDFDAINSSVQAEYAAALDQAVADGVISQDIADQLLENLPTFDGFGGRPNPRGGHGGPRDFHGNDGQSGFRPSMSLQGDGA